MISYKNFLDILVEESKAKRSSQQVDSDPKISTSNGSKTSETTRRLIQFWDKYSLNGRVEVINNELNARKMSLRQTKYKFSVDESDLNRFKTSEPALQLKRLKFSLPVNCGEQQKRKNEASNLIKTSLSVGCLEHKSFKVEFNKVKSSGDFDNEVQRRSSRHNVASSGRRSKSDSDLSSCKRVFNSKKHLSCCENMLVKSLIRKFESFDLNY
jgi:hypothetical protein